VDATVQGKPQEGDTILRSAATGGRGDTICAKLPGDGADAGGVPEGSGGNGEEGANVHLHCPEHK